MPSPYRLTDLDRLEAESIHLLRGVVTHPDPLPFPLLHVDTTWKKQEGYF